MRFLARTSKPLYNGYPLGGVLGNMWLERLVTREHGEKRLLLRQFGIQVFPLHDMRVVVEENAARHRADWEWYF